MTKHSVLPPSSAARRVACPGSRALEALYPEEQQSPYALEGETAHWLAAKHLNQICGSGFSEDLTQTPHLALVTEEMVDGANLYVNTIIDVMSKLCPAYFPLFHIEEKIDISTIHPECWGTPDCWFHGSNEICIFDYKFGHGFVEVFENWQLIEYAAGILQILDIADIDRHAIFVNFYIVQPRSFHHDGPVRHWRISVNNLQGYFEKLRNCELKSMSPAAQCYPNPECNYCLGRHACEALQRNTLTAVDVSTSNTPFDLSPREIGNELRYLQRAAELLDARISGLSAQALSLIKKGERIPFFAIEESKGRDRWKVKSEEIKVLGELFGCSLEKPLETVTPKQAIKLGIPEEIVNSYVEPVRGSLKLVPENLSKVRKIFGGK